MSEASKSTGRGTFRTLGTLSGLGLSLALPAATAVSAPAEMPEIPFTHRYQAVQHGGFVRASNSGISCWRRVDPDVEPCADVRRGAAAVNSNFDMLYSDVDRDPNTYNATRAELLLPPGARVTYARLYWGGNLRVGEQKPPEDNGRVLVAEPGGSYKDVLADTKVGHRDGDESDAYQASADVTPLVRRFGGGLWTVAQLNIAKGSSDVGAWGGWTLVVAYEKADEPLRQLSLWDGFTALGEDPEADVDAGDDDDLDADDARPADTGRTVELTGLDVPARGAGRVGVVGYDGDRGVRGDSLTVTASSGRRTNIGDAENPFNDVLNSTITDFGRSVFKRQPDYMNNLGYDADVFDLGPALSEGARSLRFRFGAENQGQFLGVLFVQADARR
ncbi:DUF3344 domain-containing protein [Streptomyces sp. NPDC093225]|uniref:DUF3344 domain-containing protein n=1 Tax=Streptomyces sp. NPDC093225 TaxID=3366034 RepID=UPI003827ED74